MQYVYKVIWEVRLEGGVLKKKTQVKTLDVANSFTDLIRWMEPLTVIKTGGGENVASTAALFNYGSRSLLADVWGTA